MSGPCCSLRDDPRLRTPLKVRLQLPLRAPVCLEGMGVPPITAADPFRVTQKRKRLLTDGSVEVAGIVGPDRLDL